MADYSLQVNVEAIDKASAVFDKISKNVNTFKSDLEGTAKSGQSNMQNLGQSMQGVGSTMTATGRVMTATVTAPVVALGTAAVKTAADFDSQMSKVQAISGATGKDMQSLRDKAREMGAKTKFSATEAGQGFEYMAMAGWTSRRMSRLCSPLSAKVTLTNTIPPSFSHSVRRCAIMRSPSTIDF